MLPPDLINVKGLDHAEILAALFNNAQPKGIGVLVARLPSMPTEPMTRDEANEYIKASGSFFDYIQGRPIKVYIEGSMLCRADLYDRDNGGEGSAARIIAGLRAAKITELRGLADELEALQ